MLNLEELVFKVNTKELTNAVTEIENLGKAVTELGNKTTTVNVKVKKTDDAVKAQTKAVKESTEETKKNISVLERQQDILKFMADGFSKGQASILATAKAAKTAAGEMEILKNVVKDQRTLMGTDPFDKSIGGLQALENELSVVTKSYELHGRQLGLTQKQATELARDYIRLRQQFIITGKDLSKLDAEYEKLVQAEVKVATAQNKLVQEMKSQDKAAKDTAKANEYLAKEMERVNRMMGNTQDITSTTNNKLIKFEEALKKSGMTAAQQTAALDKYKKSLLEIQQAGGNRQVDYLSRALGPQITDVFVGLATGQSPLMVLLQQGGQLRDQFALAGVAGADMGKMLTQAAASMLVSVKDVSMAVGGLFVNSIMGAGRAITSFATSVTGTDTALTAMKARLIAMEGIASGSGGTTGLVRVFNLAAAAVTTFTGVLAGMGLASVVAYGVALYKVIQEENALAKQLALTGNAMGLSFDTAIRLSKEMNTLGVNTGTAMQVLGQMAKTGGFVASELAMVAKAANDMNTYFGVAIEDTVKSFAKMKKEPVEALFELAKTTGMVTTETIKSVVELREQGKTAEATALAMKTLAQVNSQQVEQMKKDYNGFSLFLIELGKGIKDFYNDIFKTIFYKTDPKKQLQEQIGALEEILNGGGSVAGALSRTFNKEGMQVQLEALKEQLRLMGQASDAQQRDAAARAKEQANYGEFLKDSNALLDKQSKMKKEIEEAERKFLPLVESGLITQQQYNKYISNIRDKYKETNKEVNELDKYQKRIQESVRDMVIKTDSLGKKEQELTDAAKLRADIMDDPLWAKLPKNAQQELLATLQILDTRQREFYLAEKRQKLVEEEWKKTIEKTKEMDKLYFDISDSLGEQSKSLQESGKELDFQYSILGKSDDEVKNMTREYDRQNKLRKAFLDLEKELARIRNLPADDQESLRLQAEEQYAEQVRQINSETALKAAEDYQKAFRDIQGTITDIIATALFEGGKAGQQKLKDLLKNAFRNFVINVLINPIVGGGMNSILGIGGGSGGGIGSMVSGGLNDYITNTALGTVLTSTGGYAAAIGGGSVAAGSQAAMLAAQTSGFGVAGTALTAQAAGGTAGTLGGAYSSLTSGLASIPGWGWAAIAAIALLGGGFGQTPGEQHMGGMYSTRGSELNMDTARSITGGGGWDDGAWARDLTERGSEQVGGALKTIVDGALGEVNDAIKVFGMGPFSVDAGMAANLNGEGSDPNVFGYFNLYDEAGNLVEEYINRELGDDLTAAIAKFGGDIQEAVASVVLEGTNFKREGETNVQTLARLSTSLTAVNQVTDLLGMNSLDLSLAGGDAASSLVDLFGSIENLQSASQSFYDQFANDTIKLADAQARLDTTFADLGLSIPETRDEFYTLVQGLDLSTEAGRAAYAALLGVSDAFLLVEDTATRAAEETRQRQEEAQRNAENAQREAQRAAEEAQRQQEEARRNWEQGVQKSYSLLEKAVNKEKQALQEQLNLAKAVYDIASQAVRELRGQASSTNEMLISEARSLIETAITSGVLPDANKLSTAIAKVREELQTTRYKSKIEQDIATITLSNELQKIADLAEPQMTTAELQLAQLELILEQNKAMVNAALGTTEAVLTVQEAVAALAAAIGGKTSGTNTSGSTVVGPSGGFVTGPGGAPSGPTFATEEERIAYQIAQFEAAGKPYHVTRLPSGGITVSAASSFENQNRFYGVGDPRNGPNGKAPNPFVTGGGITRFATGGAFTNSVVSRATSFDTAVMGEAGPEAIMPLSNIGGSLGVRATHDPALRDAVLELNANIEGLRAEVRADVSHNAKTARLLDRVIPDGQSINVTGNIDGGTV